MQRSSYAQRGQVGDWLAVLFLLVILTIMTPLFPFSALAAISEEE